MASARSLSDTSELLVTLGIVSANWNERRDSVANFVPFVAYALKNAQDDVVAAPALQAAVERKFGLRIPTGALNTILRRASRERYVKIENGVMHRNKDALAEFDLDPKRTDVERQRSALLAKLQSFAATEFKMKWECEDADKALLAYVAVQAAPLLATTVTGAPFQPNAPIRHSEVVVKRFVQMLCDEDREGLGYLETFVKGSMLANVLYLPEGFGGVERHFGATQIFLDTPFVLLAIGYATELVSQSARELIELLGRFNAQLRIFEHTLSEIERSLAYAARELREGHVKPKKGSVLDYFVVEDITAADAERLIAALPSRLARAGIEIVEAPPPLSRGTDLDEAALVDTLRSKIPYLGDKAPDRDGASLAAVHRLRGGLYYARLEACPAIFVTNNSRLVQVSQEFFADIDGDEAIPICIHDHTMTTIAWLKDPVGATDLPRKQMIADCFAAMDSLNGLWLKYLKEAERLRTRGAISESEFALLRFSMAAREALVSITHGDDEAFTSGTVQEVLEVAKRNAAAQAVANAEEQNRVSRINRYHEVARAFAAVLTGAALVATVLTLALGLAFGTGWLLPAGWGRAVPAVISTCIVVAIALTLINWIAGVTLIDLAKGLRGLLEKALVWAISRVFEPRARTPGEGTPGEEDPPE